VTTLTLKGTTMKHAIISLAVAACCGFAGAAGNSDSAKDAAKGQKARIEADYKAAKDACKPMKGNAQDICEAEAKGKHNIAKAELDAQTSPGPRADEKVRKAKADATYDVAKEKCDDLAGNAKDVCRKDAKAAHTSAVSDAKVTKASSTMGAGSAKTADARADAKDDKADAQYAAAKERCDGMSGQAKDDCVTAAKKKFNKM